MIEVWVVRRRWVVSIIQETFPVNNNSMWWLCKFTKEHSLRHTTRYSNYLYEPPLWDSINLLIDLYNNYYFCLRPTTSVVAQTQLFANGFCSSTIIQRICWDLFNKPTIQVTGWCLQLLTEGLYRRLDMRERESFSTIARAQIYQSPWRAFI